MRSYDIKRTTKETDIFLSLNLDGKGENEINTGCGFLDHMLTLFAKHAHYDLEVKCVGDVEVDYHHTTEDVGICLGKAFLEALGDKTGIVRFADKTVPMDEALVLCAVDVSGRSFLVKELDIKSSKVGDFDTELIDEFLVALSSNAGITLHVRQLSGSNAHHIIEAAFKSCARSMRKACEIDTRFSDTIPSTKGVL